LFRKVAPILTILALLGFVAVVTRNTNLGPQPFSLVGEPLPESVLQQPGGNTVPLSQVMGTGRWVVLNFWTTSCTECRDEMPNLRRFAEWAEAQGADSPKLININIQDSDNDVVDYVANFQTPSPILLDTDGQVAHRYGVTGVPEMFFVDETGIVRHHEIGSLNFEGMRRTLETLKKETATPKAGPTP
jgi:cytochrome c biogenesis protein CcmG/thiol:disulfide interchange protein DsbE